MLENCQSAQERWGGVSDIIDRWLSERKDLITLYFSVLDKDSDVPKQVRRFCQILMDYLSAGHFEVYEQLVEEAKAFKDGGEKLAEELYPQILESTDLALAFNDRYDTDEHCEERISQLPASLSQLGEALEKRFELEDQLIEKLHNVHRAMVESPQETID